MKTDWRDYGFSRHITFMALMFLSFFSVFLSFMLLIPFLTSIPKDLKRTRCQFSVARKKNISFIFLGCSDINHSQIYVRFTTGEIYF